VSGTGTGRAPARPRQVTLAGVMSTVACVLLVFSLFNAMTQIHSTETQQSVQQFLSSGPGSSLGLGVDGVIAFLRAVVLLSGAFAAAGVILSVFSLLRHRGARIGLSVVAVLMLFSTTFVAGLLPFVVALAASMLWRREARDWFDGREPGPRPGRQPQVPPPSTTTPSSSPAPAPAPAPPPAARAFGTQPALQPLGSWAPPVAAPPATHAGDRRPAAVTAAVWITWVFAGVTTLLLAVVALALLVGEGELLTALQRNPEIAGKGYASGDLAAALWLIVAFGIFWSLAAMALAVLAFHRVRAGQLGLLVSAVLAGVLGVATFVVPVAAVVTVVLLLRAESSRWFAGRGSTGPPSPAPDAPPSGRQSGKPPVW
jgi:hypothetical protein